MQDYFRCEWEVEDGYVGASRPHSFNISSDEIDEDMSDSELENLFNRLLYEEFQRKVEPVSEDLEAFISWAKEIVSNEDENDEEEKVYNEEKWRK